MATQSIGKVYQSWPLYAGHEHYQYLARIDLRNPPYTCHLSPAYGQETTMDSFERSLLGILGIHGWMCSRLFCL